MGATRKWQCMTCGLIYDEGIAAGTRWKEIPDNRLYPECITPKSAFEIAEVG